MVIIMTVSVAQAKARCSDTRHGRPVVDLRPAAAPKRPLPLPRLREFRAGLPRLPVSSAEILRRLRTEED